MQFLIAKVLMRILMNASYNIKIMMERLGGTKYPNTSDETKVLGRHIYALEEEKHNSNKNEIFACLHRNMDPLIMQTVIESQFQGLRKPIIFWRFVVAFNDYIRAREWLTDLINTITKLLKLTLPDCWRSPGN